MSTYNISDKEFNTLQQLANGILMQESEFSTSARYMAKKVPGVQSLGKLLRGDIKDIGNDDTYSKGPGQIKPLGFPNKEAKKHNIAIDDYDATMLVLLDRYKHQVPSTKKNTPEGYIEAVNKYKGIDSPRNEYAKSVIDKSKTFIINGKPLDLDYEKTQQEREAKIVNTKKYNLDNFKVQPAVQESTKTTLNTPLNISPVVKKQFAEGGWLDKFEDGGEIEDMPFGMPLKEQNPFLVPEYNQPMVGKTILPDVNRPMLEGTNASEFKTSYNTGTPNEIQIPTIVGGQYIGNKGALERFKATGETFKTMADPGSYSNFYNQVGNLGLMKNKYAKGGWLDNLPKQKFDMGGFTNGEDNGGILPSWDKVKATLNPMNWGVDDYTKSGTRNQAFNAARKAGKKEFMWNNQRYNTRKDTDPIQYIGSNPNQKEYDNFLRKEYPEFFKTLNRGKNVGSITWKGSSDKESNRASINPRQTNSNINAGENPENAHRFIANMIAESSHLKDPKLFRNIFNPYDYKTTYEHIRHGEKKYEIPGTSEYDAHRLREPGMAMIAYGNLSPNNIKQIQKNLGVKDDGYFGPETYKAMQSQYSNNPNIKEALTYHKLKYQDDDKNPIHFGDDINLVKAYLQEIESEVPFKNSGRIANKLKANKDYTDKALSNIIPGSGDYNVNKLQTTLVNKGYKLPKSTTKDGKLDGVYGPETKKALLDYQSRNVKTKLRNGGWLDDK
jgi:peptidoglycan hydrolase-like protein with peptidoglycan-binding domain